MLVRFFKAKLGRHAQLASRRIVVSSISPRAHAANAASHGTLPGTRFPARPVGCAIVGAIAGAVAIVALLSASDYRTGLNQAMRVSWWFS
ncbi:hypothetical protein [Burkholderia thailandensis]|uniref:Uncharacterized protein n=1 Tax=Burkholderia thailandensis (strain ATCC 700388 / DSM 13276 / CCUG 48851 / CIP 106301 / E264) TaxID=271848 RepID=Q2T1X3_BURTA|nr:hypothetical protein [Burkholderia thailandensis]ABC39077.1 hypothetical protein BTH_I0268 [Burkholderia thailandensis E264]AHI72138.1 hypothetical protein BTQ_292 [Burkholderia thailandensis 2002721723]AHI80461.1 hypothetical protein BTJ_2194 [Burkholderia thailandensis E444]AIC86183.1 hypothetical protein BTRA_309 [Burkholderia thailandensis USAMRU Malaysia \